MEARVAVLEAHVGRIQAGLTDLKAQLRGVGGDVGKLQSDVATLTERVSHLPDKEHLGRTLRNWISLGVGAAALVNAAITWGPRLLHR